MGFDVAPELCLAFGDAGRLLDAGHPGHDVVHLPGVLDLGDAQGIGPGAHGGFQILVEEFGIDAVDADQDVLVPGALQA